MSSFSRGCFTFFFLYLYLTSTHLYYIHNTLKYIIQSFLMHLDHLLASAIFLRKVCFVFLHLVSSLHNFLWILCSVLPQFPLVVFFVAPFLSSCVSRWCCTDFGRSQHRVLPITYSPLMLGALASHVIHPARRAGAGTALPWLQKGGRGTAWAVQPFSAWRTASHGQQLPGELLPRITFMSAQEALPRTIESHFPRRGKALNKPLNHTFGVQSRTTHVIETGSLY